MAAVLGGCRMMNLKEIGPRLCWTWATGPVSLISPVLIFWGLVCAGLVLRGGDEESTSPEASLLFSFPMVMLVAGVMLIITGRQPSRPRPAYTIAGDRWPSWLGQIVFQLVDAAGGIPAVATGLTVLAAVPAAFQYGLWDPSVQDRGRIESVCVSQHKLVRVDDDVAIGGRPCNAVEPLIAELRVPGVVYRPVGVAAKEPLLGADGVVDTPVVLVLVVRDG